MTTYLIAGIILVTLCMFGKNILLTIGHLFWAACAALAGAVVGALCGGDGRDAAFHISLGAAIGVACYAWLCVSLVKSHRRSLTVAAANEDVRMRYQAQLNAEAMAEIAQSERAQAQAQFAHMPLNRSASSSSSPSDRATTTPATASGCKPRFLK